MTENNDIDFQQLSGELESILNKLQGGDVQVDEAVKLHKDGIELVSKLEKYLSQTENKLEVLRSKVSDKTEKE